METEVPMARHKIVLMAAMAAGLLSASALAAEVFMSADLAFTLYQQGKVQFIDVRGRVPYQEEHIKGAMDLPLTDIQAGKHKTLLSAIKKQGKVIVTYCDCPHGMSELATEILRKDGFDQTFALDEGFGYWQDKGYPTGSASGTGGAPQKTFYELSGEIADPGPVPDKIWIRHEATGQQEVAPIQADRTFRSHLRFYRMPPGSPIVFDVGGKMYTAEVVDGGRYRLADGKALLTSKSAER